MDMDMDLDYHINQEIWEERYSDDNRQIHGFLDSGSEHFALQLEIKHLFMKNKSNKHLLNAYINQIAENVLNGLSEVLIFIVDKCKEDENKLNKIKDIIKTNEPSPSTESNIGIGNISSFDMLSNSSIQNVCSFLERSDVKMFKLTCYDICVICHNYMNLYKFGICNVRKLYLYPSFYSNITYINYKKMMNYGVYHPSRTIYSLQEEFEKIHKIPIKYQYLSDKRDLKQSMFERQISISSDEESSDESENANNFGSMLVADFERSRRRLFLFDTRTVVVISDNNSIPKVMAECDDKFANELRNIHWKFEILQYFDVAKQVLYPLQILLLHENVTAATVVNYVEKNFIVTCRKQQEWSDHFRCPALSLYRYMQQISDIEFVPSDQNIFQSATNNYRIGMLFIQMDTNNVRNNTDSTNYWSLRQHYQTTERVFCETASQFARKLNSLFAIEIKYLHNASILKSHLNQLSSVNVDAFTIFDLNNIELNVNVFTTSARIRIEISDLMQNYIHAKYIELYSCDNYNNLTILAWDETVERLTGKFLFEFVTYDVTKLNEPVNKNKADGTIIRYFVSIYKNNSECVVPKNKSIPKESLTFTIKYLNRFKLNKRFIKYVMDELSSPVYGNSFKEILDLYKLNMDCTDKAGILYALCAANTMYYLKDEYVAQNDEYMNRLSLMIFENPVTLQVPQVDLSKPIPIWMRFHQNIARRGRGNGMLRGPRYIYINDEEPRYVTSGTPFKMWIESGDTMQDIIVKNTYYSHSDSEEQTWTFYKAIKKEKNIMYLNIWPLNEKLFEKMNDKTYQPVSNDFIVVHVLKKRKRRFPIMM